MRLFVSNGGGLLRAVEQRNASSSFISIRLLSSTCILAQVKPEHPYFIGVPGQAPLKRRLRQREVKGTLPPPRDVLKIRALRTPKHHPEFRSATTPDPKHVRKPKTEYESWKHRMAESRKKNLRESVIELYNRKLERKKHLENTSLGRRRRRERLLHAPEGEDERLTNPTITQLTCTLQKGILADPNRARRIEEKISRVKDIENAKVDARRDALHSLYMNAQHFITTQKALDERIDEIFVDQPFVLNNTNDNIWQVFGPPPTIKFLLKREDGHSKSATSAHQLPLVRTNKRLRFIAEKLTGGKIVSDWDDNEHKTSAQQKQSDEQSDSNKEQEQDPNSIENTPITETSFTSDFTRI